MNLIAKIISLHHMHSQVHAHGYWLHQDQYHEICSALTASMNQLKEG